MEHQELERLVAKVKACFLSSSKRDVTNKSLGEFTAQQIYRLQGQFTSGSERVRLVVDLQAAKRILPMTAADAEPVIKMGIYRGQRKKLYTALIPLIADRQVPESRQLLLRNFPGFDALWAARQLDQAGPYEGQPPVRTLTGTTVISNNVVVTHPGGMHYTQDPLRSLYGGVFTAHAPGQAPAAVPYNGNVQGQQFCYPSTTPAGNAQYPPQVAPPPQAMYPPAPQGYPGAPPPYAPVDVGAYPQPPQQPSTYPQSSTPVYPPSTTTGAPPGDAPPGDAPPGDAPPGDAPPGDAPPGDAPPGDAPMLQEKAAMM